MGWLTTEHIWYNKVMVNMVDNFKGARGGRWKPGQSGNPKGSPKRAVTTLLKNEEGYDNKAVADSLYKLALDGDMSAIREYLDRTEGKVTEKHLSLSLTATVTPELLEQAQKRLSTSLSDTQELLQEHNATQ